MLSCKLLNRKEIHFVNHKDESNRFNYIYHILVYFFAFFDFTINIGNANIKFFYLIAVPVLCISFINLFKQKIQKIDIFILLWIISSFFAIGHILSWSDTLACVIGECVLFLLYRDIQVFLFRYSISPYKAITFVGKMICLFSLYAIIQFMFYALFRIDIGVSHMSILGFPRPKSVFAEPDWLGMYSMVGSLIYIYLFAIAKKKTNAIGLICCGISMVLSFARAAWVGFIIGVIIILICSPIKNKRRMLRVLTCLFGVALLCLFFLDIIGTDFISSLLTRLNPAKWMTHDYGASGTRTASIDIMWHFIKLHPLTGNGSGSMNYISSNLELTTSLGYPFQINAGRGNANLLLATWFDVGLIGFLFFFSFIYYLLKRCCSLIKVREKKINDIGVILISVLVSLLVDFEFNNGIRFSTVWLFFGLINYSYSQRYHL